MCCAATVNGGTNAKGTNDADLSCFVLLWVSHSMFTDALVLMKVDLMKADVKITSCRRIQLMQRRKSLPFHHAQAYDRRA